MELVVKSEGNPFEFGIEGRLDTMTAPQLEEFSSALYDNDVSNIVVDMEKCEFVSSAGLRVIVAMQKRATMDGSLVFRNVIPEVMDVFEMTGFDKLLTIE